ncbi:PREDICTED: sushi, von Willebrand factor type A, EGF and pentraxin domain-containing protein 1-like [Amphimedon queenslandica]|uniref:Sushi domain-containing protein n=1 Tax=Amphimedon queenslandica TaxID=400682 RepID=A0AAN0JFA3_AMPQE|nr:PREDICTED: sushi, von Willebrand factor type A, EGF and pentraxin domain-containing protein 1-like [Amphimedon queenslandica]|eukprot:XP_019855457.1 PREDICTED: sushi, von Willebrand factor type A, EGF and pentraxin domain-containing protein 1-like [Amphimedon queenslandica]
MYQVLTQQWRLCVYYCLPVNSTVFVKPGSVVGIVYTDGVDYNRGQILTRHSSQTVGTCVGNVLLSQDDLVGVSCPIVPANITTALLAGAGIEPIYCPELSLQYGSINISGPYSFGTGIEYTCQTGFQLVGVSSQTCLSSGDWSDELPYCNVLNCTDPGAPSNGNRDLHSYTNGSSVFFYCYDDFTLRGNRLITCYRGTWTAPVPECVQYKKIGLIVGLAFSTLSAVLVVIIAIILVVVIVMFKHKIKKIKKQ